MGFQRVVNGRKTNKVIFKLKHAVQKLQRRLLISVSRFYIDDVDEWNRTTEVDHDMGMVVEGHFPVVTMDDVPKKFFVALSYLTNPAFVKLLQEMETKFGFDQQGVLVVPCKASELQRIMSLKQSRCFDRLEFETPSIHPLISIASE